MRQKLYSAGGKLYEAFISLALQEANIDFTWGLQLPSTSVKSDFVLLSPDGQPLHVLLITHSTSESGTNMKYWRNVEELFELKSHNPTLKVSRIAWATRWKPALLCILDKIFDTSLLVHERPYANKMDKVLLPLLPDISTLSRQATLDLLKDSIFKTRPPRWFKDFQRDLSLLLQPPPTQPLRPLWELEQMRIQKHAKTPPPTPPPIRDTHFKAGLLQLLFLRPDERLTLLSQPKAPPPDDPLSQRLRQLGFAQTRRDLLGEHLTLSMPLDYVLKSLTIEQIEGTFTRLEQAHAPQLQSYLQPLLHTEDLSTFILESLRPLLSMTPKKGAKALVRLIQDDHTHPPSHLNTTLDTLLRLAKSLDTRFSFDVLVRESRLTTKTGPQRFGGLDLCRLKHTLPDEDLLTPACRTFHQRLQPLREKTWETFFPSFLQDIYGQIYTTLIKHSSINILQEMVLYFMEQKGWKIVQRPALFRSCLSHFAGVSDRAGHPRFSFLLERAEQPLLLHVVHANHATHKHKEYPGKLRAIRYTHSQDEQGDHFEASLTCPSALLLDGRWATLFGRQDKLLRSFGQAGWAPILDMQRCVDTCFSQFS